MTRSLPAVALAASLSCVLSLSAGAALAQTTEPPRARDVRLEMLGTPWADVGYLSLGAGMTALGALALSPPDVHVAPLDGLGHRRHAPTVATVSDVVLWGGLPASVGLAFAVEALGARSRGWALARAPLILTESALLATGVVSLLKNAVGECRPRAWDDGLQRCTGTDPGHLVREDRVSFPSGHTAPLAAMAGASLGLVLLPSRPRTEFLSLFAVTGGLAVTNLVLRVAAGAHTWVDTSVGFVLGGLLGFGTAWLHTRSVPVSVGVSGTSSALTFTLQGTL